MSPVDRREAFRRAAAKYSAPHYALANTTLRPESIDVLKVGHHSSIVFERGTRALIFEGQKNRDRFVNYYRPHGARPCGDPLKGKTHGSHQVSQAEA